MGKMNIGVCLRSLRPVHSSTRSILKATGIFGGVRILLILCSLIRNKLIAVWVGPAGVGLISLYNNFIELISTLSRLSIDQSATRYISQAGTGRIGVVSKVVMRWSWGLGIVGSVCMCAMSPLLSEWSFGHAGLWWTFCVLSVVPLGMTIYGGASAVFQGVRNFKALATMGVWSTLAGIAVAVPLIYFFREKSIIWVILVYGLAAMASAMVVIRGIRMRVSVPWREIWRSGLSFIRLGALITAGLVAGQLFNYLFILFLNNYADTSVLGIYQGGYTLVNAYVGVFFTGVWVEFFPRLSATVHSTVRTSVIVSHQIAATSWLLMPIIAVFICADSLVVRLLYADSFMDMLPFITLAMAGVVMRAASWCIGTTIVAKGDGGIYVVSETLSGALFLALHVVGYSIWGFVGLGMAYIVWYVLYLAICWFVYRRRYGLEIRPEAWKALGFATLFCGLCVLAKWTLGWWAPLIMAVVVTPVSIRRLKGQSQREKTADKA